MGTPADSAVSLQHTPLRGIAAVRARLPIGRVPASFTSYLNQVYTAARNGAIPLDGQNIFVYRGDASDDEADVEFGVGVRSPFEARGAVTYCELPTGEAAVATHWGDYANLGVAHAAVVEWCRANGREPTGTRWEIYGHWTDDPTQRRTDVCYQLRSSDAPAP
jgi:effector-binding domain-containing protein